MTVFFEEEGDLSLDLPCKELAEKVIEAVIDYEKCPYEAEVNLLLTMNDEIQEMNQNFRQIDKATDVLSFPMIAYEEPGNFDFLEDVIDAFHPDTGELMLGDIVISAERASEQAHEFGQPFEREVAFLTVHSMLHLMGYDHVNSEEEELEMRSRQRVIMSELEKRCDEIDLFIGKREV